MILFKFVFTTIEPKMILKLLEIHLIRKRVLLKIFRYIWILGTIYIQSYLIQMCLLNKHFIMCVYLRLFSICNTSFNVVLNPFIIFNLAEKNLS